MQDGIGDSVVSVKEAVGKVRSLLQTELGAGFELGRGLDSQGVQSSLEFWSLLGGCLCTTGTSCATPACSSTYSSRSCTTTL